MARIEATVLGQIVTMRKGTTRASGSQLTAWVQVIDEADVEVRHLAGELPLYLRELAK